MFVDKSIQLDKTRLPLMLQEDFSALEKFYDNDDWFNFGITIENSVPSIKAFYANGTIDSETFKRIKRKFGIA